MVHLVLSLFPGADLFGDAFQREGYCVVRGPDIIYGHDIRDFTKIPRGKFDIIIGGWPCKPHSSASHGISPEEPLLPELERVIRQAQPLVFVSENVLEAPIPRIEGFATKDFVLNAHDYGANQNRIRRFTFGYQNHSEFRRFPFEPESPIPRDEREPDPFPTVLASEGKYPCNYAAGHKIGRMLTVREVCDLQGVPEYADRYFLAPRGKSKRQVYRKEFQYELIGNGVEMRTGRVVARTVKRGLEHLEANSGIISIPEVKSNASEEAAGSG